MIYTDRLLEESIRCGKSKACVGGAVSRRAELDILFVYIATQDGF